MKNYFIYVITSVIFFIAGCQKSEYELEKSIYQPDETHSGLPAYSEWGYNTFGAFYERKLFIYNENEVPAKVINTGGITRFILKGGLVPSENDGYYYNGYDIYTPTMTLAFELPGFHPDVYSDLIHLNDTIIDLAGPDMRITAIMGIDTVDMDVFNGKLQFKRVQHLIVDEQPVKIILSGYFGFQALVHGEPVSMSYGRFDVGIDEYDFAKY